MTRTLPQVPPHERIILVYKNCMEFTLGSARFMDKTEELRRVGINAQILAARSQRGGAVLGVLVSEIGRLTQQTNAVLEILSSSGSQLARSAMRTSSTGHQLLKLQHAWRLGLEQRSSARLEQVFMQRRELMLGELRQIQQGLRQHLHTLADLERMTVFIPALISLLKINVAEFGESVQQFGATADELEQFRNFILEATDSMLAGAQASLGLLADIVDLET